MSYLIDFLCVLGAIILSIGVFLQFGLGFALIVFGAIMIKFALISAYVNRGGYVSDDEE